MLSERLVCTLIKTAADGYVVCGGQGDATSVVGSMIAKVSRTRLTDLPVMMRLLGGQEFVDSMRKDAQELERNRDQAIKIVETVFALYKSPAREG
jgi:hypothetical protein